MTFPTRAEVWPIQDHPEYPQIIEAIEKYADTGKVTLVLAAYDKSGESHTKTELIKMTRGKLLAIIIDQLWE